MTTYAVTVESEGDRDRIKNLLWNLDGIIWSKFGEDVAVEDVKIKLTLSERNREYYQKHKEERKLYGRRYYQTHKELQKKYSKKYAETHRDELNAKQKEKRAKERHERVMKQLAQEREKIINEGG